MVPPFGLYAKIDALLSGVLGPAGLAEAADCGSLPDLVALLAERSAYAAYVTGLEAGGSSAASAGAPGGPDRTAIERAISPKPVRDLLGLLPFVHSEQRAFLATVLRGYEVETLKGLLRHLHHREASGESGPLPILFNVDPVASVPYATLVDVSSVDELVAVLDGTPYHQPLAEARAVTGAEGSVFQLESVLDDGYAAERWRAAGRLLGQDREAVRALFATEADLQDICWIYRGRFLREMRTDEVLPRLPGFGRRLPGPEVHALAAADTEQAFSTQLGQGPYRSLLEEDGHIRPDRLDVRAERFLLDEARALRTGYRFHMGQVVAFQRLVEREVRDVCALAECLHYGIARAELPRFVVGVTA